MSYARSHWTSVIFSQSTEKNVWRHFHFGYLFYLFGKALVIVPSPMINNYTNIITNIKLKLHKLTYISYMQYIKNEKTFFTHSQCTCRLIIDAAVFTYQGFVPWDKASHRWCNAAQLEWCTRNLCGIAFEWISRSRDYILCATSPDEQIWSPSSCWKESQIESL